LEDGEIVDVTRSEEKSYELFTFQRGTRTVKKLKNQPAGGLAGIKIIAQSSYSSVNVRWYYVTLKIYRIKLKYHE